MMLKNGIVQVNAPHPRMGLRTKKRTTKDDEDEDEPEPEPEKLIKYTRCEARVLTTRACAPTTTTQVALAHRCHHRARP